MRRAARIAVATSILIGSSAAAELLETDTQIHLVVPGTGESYFGIDLENQVVAIREANDKKGYRPSLSLLCSLSYFPDSGELSVAWRSARGDREARWQPVSPAEWALLRTFVLQHLTPAVSISENEVADCAA